MDPMKHTPEHSTPPVPILVSWIGDTELKVMAKKPENAVESDEEVEEHKIALQILKTDKASDDKTIEKKLEEMDLERAYSSIHLILGDAGKGHPEYGIPNGIPKFARLLLLFTRKNISQESVDRFIPLYRSFLCRKTVRDPATLQIDILSFLDPFDPWNYDEVYKATRQTLQSEIPESVPRDQIYFNLTPGTVTQEITLALIGKEQRGVQFIQVDKNRRHVEVCDLPWDLNLIRKADDEEFAKEIAPAASNLFPDTKEGREEKARLAAIARADMDCLLLGDTGVGKNWIAETVFKRKNGKFAQLNCATLGGDLNLLRSQLFGAVPGSYTDCPAEGVKGIVKDAAGGVLFLDEVECLKPDAQGVLLDFVQPKQDAKSFQERTYRPLGGDPKQVTLRIVAATNRPLWQMVLKHEFREDLYWRLAQLTFRVPSIAERMKQGVRVGGDSVVAHLAKNALDDFGKSRKTKASFSPEAIRLLEEQKWSGNVRQLRSVVRRALVFAPRDGVIDEDAIRRELDNGERFCDHPGETTASAVPIPGGAPDKTSPVNGSGAEQHQDIRHIPDDKLRVAMNDELLDIRARYANEALRRKGTQIAAAALLGTSRQTIASWKTSHN